MYIRIHVVAFTNARLVLMLLSGPNRHFQRWLMDVGSAIWVGDSISEPTSFKEGRGLGSFQI
jgi:hypothetical protein